MIDFVRQVRRGENSQDASKRGVCSVRQRSSQIPPEEMGESASNQQLNGR